MKHIFNKEICLKRVWLHCAIILLSSSLISGCEKFIDIDKYVYDQITLDSIFTSKERTLQYINGTASYLLDESKLITGANFPTGLAADEAFVPWVDGNHRAMYLLVDQITPRDTRGFNTWGNFYKGIRKANIILANLQQNKELTDVERRDFTGRAYFLRAYFYYSLLRLYGPVPILPDEPFDSDVASSEASYERNTYDSCVSYICEDLEKAADLLPTDREDAFLYIPSKGAALGILGRQLLYAASPLFNGNNYYSGWKRTNGEHFIAQTPDNSKWGKAAAAFKRVIDLNKYQLNTAARTNSQKGPTLPLPATVSDAAFPLGAGNIDPYKSYKSIFDGSILPTHNKELILFTVRNDGDDWTFYPNPLGGINGFSVTQDMVDAYRMADGRQYSEGSQSEKSWQAVGSGLTFSENYVLSPDRAKMHDNREPRFYASIGFNHCIWPGTSFKGTEPLKNFDANYYKDGNSQPGGAIKVDYNRTGYTSRKYVNQEDINHWNGSKRAKTFPILRYAEVLLGYVEAMNEMQGSYTDEKSGVTVNRDVSEMVLYFNHVRYRAGLPGITMAEAADYETMKRLLKQEYQVEFAFEDHRYYDLRRWKDAFNAYNRPITGLDVSASTTERQKFYSVRVWNTEVSMKRLFQNKMYFFPIDQYVLDRNAKLVQNPGW